MHNDTHASLLRPNMLPALDKGMGTLVKDLDQRGKLKDTVIVWMGDFGRTPASTRTPAATTEPVLVAWSSAAATSRAAWPTARPTRTAPGSPRTRSSVPDLYGTLYRGLGIDPTPETNASVRDNLGRPYYIAGDKPNEKTSSYWIKDLVS